MSGELQGSISRISITPDAVEAEVNRLFGGGSNSRGLIIRVHGADEPGAERTSAFKELLESLSIYSDQYRDLAEIEIEPPDERSVYQGLLVLGKKQLQQVLFRKILVTLGREIVDPLGEILSTTPDGTLFNRIVAIRHQLRSRITNLRMSYETRAILLGDLDALLTDDYLMMLVEHEEIVQHPRAEALVQKILHLIGETLRQAFEQWPDNAKRIAASIARHTGSQVQLRENPQVIRNRIVAGIEGFLWIETSNELNGMLRQLFSEKQFAGLLEPPYPELTPESFKEFAETCWELVAEHG